MIKNIKKIAFSFNEKYVSQALTEIKGGTEQLKAAGLKYEGGASHGFQLSEYSSDRETLIAALKNAVMVFVRHCCTYEYEMELELGLIMGSEKLKTDVSELAGFLMTEMEGYKGLNAFSIQGRAFEQNEKELLDEIRTELETNLVKRGKTLEVKYPELIISLYLKEDRLMAGVGLPEENRSRWSGGMAHYKQETWEVSRSMYKLMEALEVFKVETEGGMRALDLGAAPGGWSSVLLRRGLRVTSVDTGEMDAELLKQKAMEFLKVNAAELDLGDREIDLLVSDMSWNATQTAKTVCKAAKWLKAGGYAIVTVKLLNGKPVKSLTEVKKVYNEVFEIMDCRQLFHNREEVTLYMKKR